MNVRVVACLWLVFLAFATQADAVVFLLNGTSSAGKSTVAKSLLRLFDGVDCLYLNRDNFFQEELVKVQQTRCFVFVNVDSIADQAKHDLWQAIKGHNITKNIIIVDAVLAAEDLVQEYRQALEGIVFKHILVYADLESVIRNIEKRNQSFCYENKRRFFDAIYQFSFLYGPKKEDEQAVGVLSPRAVTRAHSSLSKDFLCAETEESVKIVKRSREIQQRFDDMFRVQPAQASSSSSCEPSVRSRAGREIEITPQITYDLVVVNQDVEQCATQIKEFMEQVLAEATA